MQHPSDFEKLIVGGFLGVLLACAASTAAHGLTTTSSNSGRISAPATVDSAGNSGASSVQSGPSLEDFCTFAPQPDPCAPVYRKAMRSSSPAAETIRAAYERYARYLKNDENTLTAADRQYLIGLEIGLPDDLNSAQQSGLHNVINDPALQTKADDRKAAVINFILRAEEANIYCGQNSCPYSGGAAPQGEGSAVAGNNQGQISWQLSSPPSL
jgi:hypothetical protein